MTKKCFKCGAVKNISYFYEHKKMADGHLNKCKVCTKRDVKERYFDPVSRKKIIAYEKKRAQDPRRREMMSKYQKGMRRRHKGKYRARHKVSTAVRDGRLEKGSCEVCGGKKVEAHHEDYRQYLKVRWLCRKHHLLAEGKTSF